MWLSWLCYLPFAFSILSHLAHKILLASEIINWEKPWLCWGRNSVCTDTITVLLCPLLLGAQKAGRYSYWVLQQVSKSEPSLYVCLWMIINFVAVDLKGLFHGASIDRRSTILKPEKKTFINTVCFSSILKQRWKTLWICPCLLSKEMRCFLVGLEIFWAILDVSVVQQDINLFH